MKEKGRESEWKIFGNVCSMKMKWIEEENNFSLFGFRGKRKENDLRQNMKERNRKGNERKISNVKENKFSLVYRPSKTKAIRRIPIVKEKKISLVFPWKTTMFGIFSGRESKESNGKEDFKEI